MFKVRYVKEEEKVNKEEKEKEEEKVKERQGIKLLQCRTEGQVDNTTNLPLNQVGLFTCSTLLYQITPISILHNLYFESLFSFTNSFAILGVRQLG